MQNNREEMAAQACSHHISSHVAQRGILSVHHCCLYLSFCLNRNYLNIQKPLCYVMLCSYLCHSCFSEKAIQMPKVTITSVCAVITGWTCSSSSSVGPDPAPPGLDLVLCALSLLWPANSETFNSVHIPNEREWDSWTFKGYEMARLLYMGLCEGDPCFFS